MVRLILYNIEYCEGTTKSVFQYLDLYHIFRAKKNYDQKMIDFLKNFDPDILALVEVDGGSIRSGHIDVVDKFSKSLGLDFVAKAVKYTKQGFFKYFRKLPLFKFQENALLSSIPLSEVNYHYLSKGSKRVVIEAMLELKRPVRLLLVHLALFRKTRLRQINDLIKIVNSSKIPTILFGDFNTFKDDELKLILDKTNLHDAYNEDAADHTISATEPSWKPKYRLDHVLISSDIKLEKYKILDAHFSDHLPVMIDFKLK
ncbi:MAG: endonuclease/exonuclease/phosphatase family protein [Candidatus Woesearchaeota archaeon]